MWLGQRRLTLSSTERLGLWWLARSSVVYDRPGWVRNNKRNDPSYTPSGAETRGPTAADGTVLTLLFLSFVWHQRNILVSSRAECSGHQMITTEHVREQDGG